MAIFLNIFILVALCCISATGGISTCPDGSPPVNCLLDPCDPRIAPTCDAFPNAVCQSDFCGGCNARFFVGKEEVTTSCATGCPDGSPPVNCFVDPCDPRIAPTCEAFPNAVCQSDFCGGCNARFFVGKEEVTTSCATGCPDGSPPVNCFVDPCDPRIAPTCEAFPNAVCQSDFCGGCNAKFFVGGREVTDMCGNCPDGSPPVNCLLDPCDPRIAPTCEAFPNAVCQSDFCGGCNAKFFVGGREVTDMCDTCPDGSEPVNCFADPCQDATCASFPEATCQSDFCGGCNARFFVRRREVTDLCDRRCPYKGQFFFECLPCQQSCDGTVTCNVACQSGCGCRPGKAFHEEKKRCVPPVWC